MVNENSKTSQIDSRKLSTNEETCKRHFEVLLEMEGRLLLSRGCPGSILRVLGWVP